MAVTVRFRPVAFGSLARPTAVFYIVETSDGRVFFRELEFAWPLSGALEKVTVEDLPGPYRSREAAASILPVQEATGQTMAEAHRRMTSLIEATFARDENGTRQKQAPPPRRRGVA
ncbi:MAG: hypothetical protein HY690_15960 [Chloroflexi bacterium]|nr:hypothetical protein [Chloroflexota bacterium]